MCKLSMCLLVAVFGCLLASGLAGVNRDAIQVDRDIVVVKDVRDFAAKHPGLKLQRMDKQTSLGRSASVSVRYTLGSRISGKRFRLALAIVFLRPEVCNAQWTNQIFSMRLSGDRLVAQNADVYSYPARNDVSLQLTYPETGAGAIVTFVEIICTQDNSDGIAYVVAGGIGQRFISVVIEAQQTENFAYQAQYFGTD